jgi:hypothetical protein
LDAAARSEETARRVRSPLADVSGVVMHTLLASCGDSLVTRALNDGDVRVTRVTTNDAIVRADRDDAGDAR